MKAEKKLDLRDMLDQARADGLVVELDAAGDLTISGPKAVRKAYADDIAAHRDEVKALLAPTGPAPVVPELTRAWPSDSAALVAALLEAGPIRSALDLLGTRVRGFHKYDARQLPAPENDLPLVSGDTITGAPESVLLLAGDTGPVREGGPCSGTFTGKALAWSPNRGALVVLTWDGRWGRLEHETEVWKCSLVPYRSIGDALAEWNADQVLAAIVAALREGQGASWGSVSYQAMQMTMGAALTLVEGALVGRLD